MLSQNRKTFYGFRQKEVVICVVLGGLPVAMCVCAKVSLYLLHGQVFCLEPCPRPRKACTHLCPKRCGDSCPAQCLADVFQEDTVLDGGHLMQVLSCWQHQDLSTVRCPVLVEKVAPHCKHTVEVACHVDVESIYFDCTAQCRAPLSCGHTCKSQ